MQENLTSLQQSLQKIRQAIQQVQTKAPNIHIIITGDFNRHNELWGGSHANPHRSREAEPILGFISEFQLWSALPQGTPMFRNWGTNQWSIIDLVLISNKLQQRLQACMTHDIDHGSDHSAISLTLNYLQHWKIPIQRRLFNIAN